MRLAKPIAFYLFTVVALTISVSARAQGDGLNSIRSNAATAGQSIDDLPGYTVPFEYDPLASPYIIVKARVNKSEPLLFLVDTGCSAPILIFQWAADKLGLKAGKPDMMSVPSNMAYSDGPKIRLAFLRSNETTVIDVDSDIPSGIVADPDFPHYKPKSIAGVIGMPIFCFVTVRFNFQTHNMKVFTDPHAPLIGANTTALPLSVLESYMLYLPVTNSDGTERLLLIDTGSPTTDIPCDAAEKIQTSGSYPSAEMDFHGNWLMSRTVLADSISLNGVKIESVPLSVTGRTDILTLGTDVLRRFNFTIDYRNRQFILDNTTGTDNPRRNVGFTGIWVKKDKNGLYVDDVRQGSPAAAAGVKRGSRLLRIDGVPIGDRPVHSARGLLQGFEGWPYRLRVQELSGRRREMVITPESSFEVKERAVAGFRLRWRKEEGLVVEGLQAESLAYSRGLREGDTVIEANGKAAAATPFETLFDNLGGRRASLLVKHRSGSTEKIVLEPAKEVHRKR